MINVLENNYRYSPLNCVRDKQASLTAIKFYICLDNTTFWRNLFPSRRRARAMSRVYKKGLGPVLQRVLRQNLIVGVTQC